MSAASTLTSTKLDSIASATSSTSQAIGHAAPSTNANPTQHPVIQLLLQRHTTRRFQARHVPEAALQAIIACGDQAPSALGKRDPLLVACTDARTNRTIGRINRALSTERERGLADHVSTDQPSIIDDPRIEDGFYGAPAVIYAFTPADWEFAREDAAIASDAMMVAAQALGLGSCYVSRARETFATPWARNWAHVHDIPDTYEGAFCLCLGYPA